MTIKLMQQAESRVDAAGNPLFEFAITEDQGALKECRDNGWASCDCWPAGSSNCTVTTQLVSDLDYAFNTFYPSPAYMRRGGRPVVFFFIDETQYPNIDWNWARSNLQGNPLLVFRNSGGFTHSQSNGAFSWLSTSGDTASDPASLAYLNNFYDTAKTRAGSPQVFGSSYKGFDDSLAGWAPSPPREIAQRCGQTWLDSWAEANRNYSAGGLHLVLGLPGDGYPDLPGRRPQGGDLDLDPESEHRDVGRSALHRRQGLGQRGPLVPYHPDLLHGAVGPLNGGIHGLFALAYAFEQAVKRRVPPPATP